MNYSKQSILAIALLASAFLTGCSSQSPSPETLENKPAPAPSNLSPEDKAKYDDAIKNAGPPAGK